VWRHLGASAEFVVVRPAPPSDRLRVRVEGVRDDDVTDRMAYELGVAVDVEWVGPGELSRAAYKAQRVVSEAAVA
jgi:phenylacetate-coenzyme A ligase PaaK-like adenylate-forming protein